MGHFLGSACCFVSDRRVSETLEGSARDACCPALRCAAIQASRVASRDLAQLAAIGGQRLYEELNHSTFSAQYTTRIPSLRLILATLPAIDYRPDGRDESRASLPPLIATHSRHLATFMHMVDATSTGNRDGQEWNSNQTAQDRFRVAGNRGSQRQIYLEAADKRCWTSTGGKRRRLAAYLSRVKQNTSLLPDSFAMRPH